MSVPSPDLSVQPVLVEAILDWREEYRREMNCQIVHDCWHARGFTNSYLLRWEERVVGYGSVGGVPGEDRDTVKEFFVASEYRGASLPLFRRLLVVSQAHWVEAQTNDRLLSLMLFDCTVDWRSSTILFADDIRTQLDQPQAKFRPLTAQARASAFIHKVEPVGDWGLECEGRIVATGGYFCHFNPPYADVYMEVDERYRGRGLGSFLVQELKRICREAGYIPAARCSLTNTASRRTLQRAGFLPCARILRGRAIE